MYDLVIKNASVLDGTGTPSYFADLALKDGVICRIGKNLSGAEKILDVTGLTVSPGFIDSHSHSDKGMVSFPDMIEKAEQGITTCIAGQCGSSVAPANISGNSDVVLEGIGKKSDVCRTMGSFLDAFRNFPMGVNQVCLLGHSSIRRMVMGMEQRVPTAEELEAMKNMVREAMEHGALGLSFGLIYPPGSYAQLEEIVALAQVVKEYGGLIAAHIRSEGSRFLEAQEEFCEVIRRTGVRGVHSHFKSAGGSSNWGKVKPALEKVDEMNRLGYEVFLDVYPYIASHTTLSVSLVPDSGRDLLSRLRSPEERKKMKEWNRNCWWKEDLSWVQIARCKAYPEYEGKRIPEIAALRGTDHLDTAFDLILDSENACSACYFTVCEEDVKTVLAHPRAMIGTDANVAGNSKVFHPRLKGTFPRALGRYARDLGVVSMEEMIRKMTSMPAAVYGLKKKGLIREGMDADLCIFDRDRILDHAEFTACRRPNEGLHYVLINGKIVVENGVYNRVRAGKLILRDF